MLDRIQVQIGSIGRKLDGSSATFKPTSPSRLIALTLPRGVVNKTELTVAKGVCTAAEVIGLYEPTPA